MLSHKKVEGNSIIKLNKNIQKIYVYIKKLVKIFLLREWCSIMGKGSFQYPIPLVHRDTSGCTLIWDQYDDLSGR